MYSILDRDFLSSWYYFEFRLKDIYCIAAWIEIHHILPKNTLIIRIFNAILGRHFWSNAGEICWDVLIFFQQYDSLGAHYAEVLVIWKMIESTGLLLISCDKQTNKLEYLFFYW